MRASDLTRKIIRIYKTGILPITISEDLQISMSVVNRALAHYLKKPKAEIVPVVYSRPYQERDNEIIKVFSKRNRKGALSMSHIEPKILVNTRMKI